MTSISTGASTSLTGARTSDRPELLAWLRSGRLTLVGFDQEPVTEEEWFALSPDTQERALADFDRVVRGNAKAAVIFLAR